MPTLDPIQDRVTVVAHRHGQFQVLLLDPAGVEAGLRRQHVIEGCQFHASVLNRRIDALIEILELDKVADLRGSNQAEQDEARNPENR